MEDSLVNVLNEIINTLFNKGIITHVQSDASIDIKIELLRKVVDESDNISQEQCYSMANNSLRLWNLCLISEDIDLKQIISIQELVFNLIRSLSDPPFVTPEWLRIKSDIALSLGKQYLMLKDKDGFKEKAIVCFEYAEAQLSKIIPIIGSDLVIDKQILTLLALIEAHENNFDVAVEIYKRLENAIKNREKHFHAVIIVLYNLGLHQFHLNNYHEAMFWLESSLTFVSKDGHKKQILCLLADVYLTWDGNKYREKTEKILKDLDEDCPQTQLIRLKLCFVKSEAPDELKRLLDNLFNNSTDISPDQKLKIIECLLNQHYKELALSMISCLENQVNPELAQLTKIFGYQLQCYLDENRLTEAEDSIRRFLSNDEAQPSLDILNILKRQCDKLRRDKKFSLELEWLNLTKEMENRLLPENDDMSHQLTKYDQQICSCLINLNKWKEANEVLDTLKNTYGSDHTIVHSLQLHICIGLDLKTDALKCIQLLCENCHILQISGDLFKLFIKCIKFGINLRQFSIASIITDRVIDIIDCRKTCVELMELLFKLKISCKDDMDQMWPNKYGSKILELIQQDFVDGSKAKWFVKVFWNLAHSNNHNKQLIHNLLKWSSRILSCCEMDDPNVIMKRLSCLLLSVSAGMEAYYSSQSHNILTSIQDLVEEFKTFKISSCPALEKAFELIDLYELQVKFELKSPNTEAVFRKCLTATKKTTKYVELLAAIVYKRNLQWTVECIQLAISIFEGDFETNAVRILQLYHSLMNAKVTQLKLEEVTVADVHNIVQEILKLLKKITNDAHKKLLETELAWFVATSWNIGVERLQLDDEIGAQMCCMSAMKMALHMGVNYQGYLEKMNAIYPVMMKKDWSMS